MKGYKAFKKGMICDPTGHNPKQYAENTVFEEDTSDICKSGMHFCKNPLDVLDHYPLVDEDGNMTEFAEVEALDDCKTDDNKKFCTKKLKVGAKLSLPQFIKASVEVTYENIKSEVEEETKQIKNKGDKAQLVGGNGAQLVGGNEAKLVGGYEAQLVGGNEAQLVGGNGAKLVGGYGAKLVGGYGAKLVGGNWAKLVGGNWAKLVGGYGAKLVGGYEAQLVGGNGAQLVGGNEAQLVGGNGAQLVGGNEAKLVGGYGAKLVGGYGAKLVGGENSIIVGDNGSIAKGNKDTVIMLIERDNFDKIVGFKAMQVDGVNIKEDTWYKLVDGDFVEVDENG